MTPLNYPNEPKSAGPFLLLLLLLSGLALWQQQSNTKPDWAPTTSASQTGAPAFERLRVGLLTGRARPARDRLWQAGGGTPEAEAAIANGLHWLVRVQTPTGAWDLGGKFDKAGAGNEIAGTAFGLLPFLGAGYTHRAAPDNPYAHSVEQGLKFLLTRQNPETGDLGGGMYSHTLATLALCEAFGMTQDPQLRQPAQRALDYLIRAQNSGGGWRYHAGQPGDMSVTGWVVQALKSGTIAGLQVPETTYAQTILFLNNCTDSKQGYGYTGRGSTPTMTAVGLLCRQYLQAEPYDSQSARMWCGISLHLETNPPGQRHNTYYYFYATRVLHHFGGPKWWAWNEPMRDELVKRQEKDGPEAGSWAPHEDDHFCKVGGRLMETSLCLLTLEVYYRQVPLHTLETTTSAQR